MPFNMPRPLILASTSSTRKALLSRLHLPYEAIGPNVDETPHSHETAPQLALRLSIEKAANIASKHPNAIVIGSDQVVWREGQPELLIGKPLTVDKACEQLRLNAGRLVHFETAFSVQCAALNLEHTELVRFSVKFRDLTTDEIQRYVELDDPLHCAGSFKCESLGISLFEQMIGNDFTALMGLPLIRLGYVLRELGFRMP